MKTNKQKSILSDGHPASNLIPS